MKYFTFLSFILIYLGLNFNCLAQPAELNNCNITWTSHSKNSSESMPCGGHDIEILKVLPESQFKDGINMIK